MTTRSNAIKFIILLGIVSLFADATYEGARSITGPYLSLLGASGAVVGIVIGFAELVGYGMRGISGYLSDKTKSYWTFTFVGYIINLLAVPLLALAGSWQIAAFLIVLERFGKALRTPARDTMLSYATKHTGRGWGFGLHEALDQIGAVLGPLAITILFFFKESYQIGFASLLLPALIAIIVLIRTRFSFPHPQAMESTPHELKTKSFSKQFWIYLFAIGCVALGFVSFPLIAFHFAKTTFITPTWIPFFYAIAMGVDGLAALIMGRLFDLRGMAILALVTGVSSLFAPLVFFGNFYGALFGMVLWGIGMGSQESIMRAAVSLLVPANKRGSAYGILHLTFGIFWAVGNAVMGFLYDISPIYIVIFSLIAQLASIPFFLSMRTRPN